MGPEAISISQINLYLTCSLKYRFQYIDRLPRLVQSAAMVFGSAAHTLSTLDADATRKLAGLS